MGAQDYKARWVEADLIQLIVDMLEAQTSVPELCAALMEGPAQRAAAIQQYQAKILKPIEKVQSLMHKIAEAYEEND